LGDNSLVRRAEGLGGVRDTGKQTTCFRFLNPKGSLVYAE